MNALLCRVGADVGALRAQADWLLQRPESLVAFCPQSDAQIPRVRRALAV
jgi:hypothetical protein